MSSLAALALIAACTQSPAETPRSLEQLPPRKPIAGLAGFQSTSVLSYDVDTSEAQVLETTYVFPDRARWHLGIRGGDPGVRHIDYRYGEAFFELPEGSKESRRIERLTTEGIHFPDGAGSLEKCYASELRRALFLWPDGFEWRGEGNLRVAPIVFDGFGPEVQLTARLGADGRPVRMRVSSEMFDSLQAYENITWREARGRWWPASMRLLNFNQPIWTETVESVDTAVHFLDEFFLPPDRRGAQAGTVRIDLPAGVVRRVALPEHSDWPSARAAATKLANAELLALVRDGWKPEAGTWYELDDAGRPIACLLRLRASSKAIPDGWLAAAEATAVVASVAQLDGDLSATLLRMRGALPAGAVPAATLAREFPGDSRTRAQVVIALKPAS